MVGAHGGEPVDVLAIQSLKYRYCHTVDDGRYEEWASLFADGARLNLEGMTDIEGRAEIRAFGKEVLAPQYESTAHMATNPVIAVNGDDARGQWYFLLVSVLPDETVELSQGRYEEAYVRVDGEWRFAEITARFDVSTELEG